MEESVEEPTLVELSNGLIAEIKLINLAGGSVDYRITNGEYDGDCCLYLQITDLSTALEEIRVALEAEYVKEEE